MNCSKCGAEVAEGNKFCSTCGQEMGGVSPTQPVMGAQTPQHDTAAEITHAVTDGIAHAGDALKRVGVPAGLVERVVGVLTNPKDEWTKIVAEGGSIADLFTKYAVLLALIPLVGKLIGLTILFMHFPGAAPLRIINLLLPHLLVMYAVQLGGLFIMAVVLKQLAPNFGAHADLHQATKVAVYSSTPMWLAGVLYILNGFLSLPHVEDLIALVAAVYSVYLLWMGIGAVLQPKPDQQAAYTVTGIVCFIVVMAVAQWIATPSYSNYVVGRMMF